MTLVRACVPKRRRGSGWRVSYGNGACLFWDSGTVGGVMESRLATIVVESRLLVREAFKSLMASNSCRVICDIGSTAEISGARRGHLRWAQACDLGAQSARKCAQRGRQRPQAVARQQDHRTNTFPPPIFEGADVEINGCVRVVHRRSTLISSLDMVWKPRVSASWSWATLNVWRSKQRSQESVSQRSSFSRTAPNMKTYQSASATCSSLR